jgi:hypothetical protein
MGNDARELRVMDLTTMATLIYAGGVLVGLARIDAPPRVRTALALLWPIGPMAFLVTIAILIIAALIAFPSSAPPRPS